MINSVAPHLLGVLCLSTVLWLVLTDRLYSALRTRHPSVYAELGSPSLFWNNSPAHGVFLLRFVLGRNHRRLRNPGLTLLGRSLFALFWVHLAVFLGILCLMVLSAT